MIPGNESRCHWHDSTPSNEKDWARVIFFTRMNYLGTHTFFFAITYSEGKDQPGKVANPARGQLNREN